VTTISTAGQLTEFKDANKLNVIGHAEEGSDGYKVFSDASENLKLESFKFAVITDKSLAKSAGIKKGQFHLNRDFDDQPLTFDQELNIESLAQFITTLGNGYPYFDHAQNSWVRLSESSDLIGLVVFDYDNAETAQSEKDLFTSLAKEFVGKVAFAFIGAEYLKKATELGVSGDRVPTLVVVGHSGLNYPYPDSKAWDKESLSTWVSGILSGEIKPHFKSEAAPADNDGPVKIIVGSTFDEIVINNKQDVLVEFYAPWCGHCKHLEPLYEQLGEFYQEDENVVIAKIDATANDNTASLKIQGFPTIYLFPANDKSQPLIYEGERQVESFIQFITENGSFGEEAEEEDSHGHGHGHGHDHDHQHEDL